MRQRAWDSAAFVRFRGIGSATPGPGQEGIGERPAPRRPAKAEEGAAVVEFSLVSALIIVVAWGIIQFGIVYNRYQGLQAAGREGARYGAASQATIGAIQDRVKRALDSVIDTGSARYVATCPSDPKTLSVDSYCINVARRDSAGATPTLLTTTGYDSSSQPCNLAQNKTVVVSVHHKMRVSIPLWAVVPIDGTGAGEFRCET